MRAVFLLFCCLAAISGHAQTTVQGLASSFKGQEIKLLTYSDLVTRTMHIAARDTIAADGTFSLTFEPRQTLPVVLRIDKVVANLYVEPETSYDIEFPRLEEGNANRPEELVAAVKINSEGASNLNRYWRSFKEQYFNYMAENYVGFMRRQMRYKVQPFIDSMQTAYGSVEHPYFKQLLKYELATLQLNAFVNRSKIYTLHLHEQPVLYQNDVYMDFVLQFYQSAVDRENHPPEPQLAEVIQLSGLLEKAATKKADPTNQVLGDLRDLMNQSEYKQNRHIAANVIRKTNKLAVGNPAPDFTLLDKNGKEVSLSDFRGKYVYIDFWATWCSPCLAEMEVMERLHKKYGRKVVFLSISVDKRPEQMNRFLKRNKYKWTFLHYGNQPSIKDIYRVYGVPVYYLIDPDGFLVQSPAHRPTGKIEEHLEQVAGKRRGRKSFEEVEDYRE